MRQAEMTGFTRIPMSKTEIPLDSWKTARVIYNNLLNLKEHFQKISQASYYSSSTKKEATEMLAAIQKDLIRLDILATIMDPSSAQKATYRPQDPTKTMCIHSKLHG